jgi:hypothetical protein
MAESMSKRTLMVGLKLWKEIALAAVTKGKGRQEWIREKLQESVWDVLKAPEAERMGMVKQAPNSYGYPAAPEPSAAQRVEAAAKTARVLGPCSCMSPTEIDALCDVHGHLAVQVARQPEPPRPATAPDDIPPWEEDAAEEPAFDPQAHYDEVLKKLSPRSALDDTRRAIEFHFLEDTYPAWLPADKAVYDRPVGAGVGPITAAEFEVPAAWVDNAGHTRAQNLARFGEDEAIEYWPPPPRTAPGEDRI